jgi:glucose-1-phosphate cytidylyltransferase
VTDTGGRIKRLAPHIGNATFMLTWCDGLSNVNLRNLLVFHRSHGKLATVTTVRAPGRIGYIELDENAVSCFCEKPADGDGWINGAFFVLEPGVFEYIDGDTTSWERESMPQLAIHRQLAAYRHDFVLAVYGYLARKAAARRTMDPGEGSLETWE